MRTATLLVTPLLALATVAVAAPVRLGQSTHVDGPRVRPLRVIEDSRCPDNARCIWAGRVVVRVAVSGGNWRRTLDLTLGDAGVPVGDGRLRLVAVTPTRATTARIPPRAYRFDFAFDGGF